MIAKNITNLVAGDEGCRLQLYYDSLGNPTIGYGHLCGAKDYTTAITQQQANDLLQKDLEIAAYDAKSIFKNIENLSEARQGVLISMSFELGVNRLLGFHHFIDAVNAGDWQRAVKEMFNSLWATQVPNRVNELANLLQRGGW